jgi:hypothetical protein
MQGLNESREKGQRRPMKNLGMSVRCRVSCGIQIVASRTCLQGVLYQTGLGAVWATATRSELEDCQRSPFEGSHMMQPSTNAALPSR